MALVDAVDDVKREAANIADILRNEIAALDFSLASILSIRDKYNAILLDVLGSNYDRTVDKRSLPPINPSAIFDQKRAGLADLSAIGDVFLPSVASSTNLASLQEFYLSAGEDLSTVRAELDNHPPREPVEDRFTISLNQFVVKIISASNSDGLPKTREDVAKEIGQTSFELFIFTDLPDTAFLVIPKFISLDSSLSNTARQLGIRQDQITVRVIWYGTINASTFNFNKMRTSFQLSNPQIRVASFGDDLAISSSALFNDLLDNMASQLALIQSQTSVSKQVDILDNVQEIARTFLAQMVFGTTTIVSTDLLDNLLEAGITDASLSSAFENRDDDDFRGVNDTANSLRTLAFPSQSNIDERRILGEAFRQSPDTPRFTTRSLNANPDLRDDVVVSAKRVIAGIDARRIVIQRPTSSSFIIAQAVAGVVTDVGALRSTYETFLTPTTDSTRQTGTRTTESSNNILTRATDLVKSLRIADQINEFPTDIDDNLDESLAVILGGLGSIANSIKLYFDTYRDGEVRDFLAAAVSVSSMTNFVLANGDPKASLIVVEVPERIEELRASVQSNILDDLNSEDLYSSVSLQVGALSSVLRGNEEDDPVGRLFDLPVSIIDAILPPSTPGLEMLPQQEAAMRQLRESFALLKTSRSSTNRDLGIYDTNFGCAVADAKFLLARLAGDSVNQLVTELGRLK